MRALVTGGSGFIGTNLVRRLTERGDVVVNLDIAPPRDARLKSTWTRGNLLDADCLRVVLDRLQPDVVFHLGARTDLHGRTLEDYAANVRGTQNVVDAVRSTATPPRVIYASSRLVFAVGHTPRHILDYMPSTIYGLSKIEAEKIVLGQASDAGVWTIVRPTSIWGPWFATPYRDFFDSVLAGRFFNVRGRDTLKSFGYVGNSIHQLLAIAEAPEAEVREGIFWLTDYPATSVSQWAEAIAVHSGRPVPKSLPYPVLRTAASIGTLAQKLGYREPPLTRFRLDNLVTNMVYDTSATEALVGDLPYGLDEGVEETLKWLRQRS